MKKKILLIISLSFIILVSIVTNIYIISKDNKKENNNERPKYLQDKTYEQIKITNASIEVGDELSSYKAIVTNISNTSISIDKLYIKFYIDKEETKILALSNIELPQNENTIIDIVSEEDLSKITDIDYELE